MGKEIFEWSKIYSVQNTSKLRESFFKDKASEYIFILLYTDAHVRCKLLNITEDLYRDNAKAIEWYKNIYDIITNYPDKEVLDGALRVLNNFYYSMMGEEE